MLGSNYFAQVVVSFNLLQFIYSARSILRNDLPLQNRQPEACGPGSLRINSEFVYIDASIHAAQASRRFRVRNRDVWPATPVVVRVYH